MWRWQPRDGRLVQQGVFVWWRDIDRIRRWMRCDANVWVCKLVCKFVCVCGCGVYVCVVSVNRCVCDVMDASRADA